MKQHLSLRFWLEAVAGTAAAALLVITLVWRTWIETVFGVDPDHSSGALEWIIVGVALAVVVGSTMMARQEWRRQRAATGMAS